MKPIIIDMKEMSDSTEVYESKPNRFMIYTIYVLLLLFAAGFIWMYASKIEIVVKSNGMFKGSTATYEVSSGVTGRVEECNIVDGQYVNEGDVLYVLDIDALSDTIVRYQNELEAAKDRIEILSAYERSLDGGIKELEICIDNPYYEEFVHRRELLFANMTLSESDINGQTALYQGSIDSISETISKYNEKINKLNTVKQCIKERNNTLDSADSYYYSMVSSYITSYNYTALQYDNKLSEYQMQIDAYDEQIQNAEGQAVGDEAASGSDAMITAVNVDVEALKQKKNGLVVSKDTIELEKTQALLNLELQQLTTIEQQISSYSDTILSMETNLEASKLQLEAVNGVDNETKKNVAILTEKGSVSAEMLSYQEKLEECEGYLKSYDIQNDNCTIKANISGYYYVTQTLKSGSYIQEGTTLGTIYPEKESKYYAEIYVNNSDIAKIKEGQEVKFEIAAYPSREYGYYSGVVESIARDISVDQGTGYAYYLVKIRCENMTIKDGAGEEVSLKNGMACQAKIVVDEQRVLTYVLDKIDLLD